MMKNKEEEEEEDAEEEAKEEAERKTSFHFSPSRLRVNVLPFDNDSKNGNEE